MRLCMALLCGAGLLQLTQSAALAGELWTLQDVAFSDGATASGFFVLNDALALTSWDVTLGPLSGVGASILSLLGTTVDLTPQNSFRTSQFRQFIFYDSLDLVNADATVALTFFFASPLSGSGGTIPISTSSEYSSYSMYAVDALPAGEVIAGYVTGSPVGSSVPEPASSAEVALVIGFWPVFRLWQRRRRDCSF